MHISKQDQTANAKTTRNTEDTVPTSVVRLLDFHNRSSKIIIQEFLIDDRL